MTSKWKTDSFIRTGIRHNEEAMPCQDYVKITHLPNGDIYAGLSDGISSSRNSEQASENAVVIGGKVLEKMFRKNNAVRELVNANESKLEDIFGIISESLIGSIQDSFSESSQADATYVFVYILRGKYALVGFLGDSCVCMFSRGKSIALTQTRDYGGATESVRHPSAKKMMKLQLVDLAKEQIDGFLLSSDGLEDVLYTKGDTSQALGACQDYVNTLFEDNGHKKVEQKIDEVCKDGSFDDDISLALIARRPISVQQDPTWLCSCGKRNSLMTTFCECCNKDFYTIYSNAPVREHGSAWDYFRYLNAHPEEEAKMAGATLRESDHNQTAKAAAQNRPAKKKPRKNGFGKKAAAICVTAAVIAAGIAAFGFFQIMSLSQNVREMEAEIDSLTVELEEIKAAPKPEKPPKATAQTHSATQPSTEQQNESGADDEQSTTGAVEEAEYNAGQNDQNYVNDEEYQQ